MGRLLRLHVKFLPRHGLIAENSDLKLVEAVFRTVDSDHQQIYLWLEEVDPLLNPQHVLLECILIVILRLFILSAQIDHRLEFCILGVEQPTKIFIVIFHLSEGPLLDSSFPFALVSSWCVL